jgi:CRP-like cAMP-binding protein
MATSPTIVSQAAERLRATSIFGPCRDSDIESILRVSVVRHLEARDVLFHQNEACGSFYLLLSGSIALIRRDQGGREKIIEFVDPGDTFAEPSLFCGEGCLATAVAAEESDVLEISAMPFIRMLQQDPDLGWRVLARVSHRLHEMLRQVESLSLYNARQKLAAYLIDRYDDDEPDAPLGGIPRRRKDLASLLAVTPETLSRELSWLRGNGIIANTDKGGIVVVDPGRLEEMIRHSSSNRDAAPRPSVVCVS